MDSSATSINSTGIEEATLKRVKSTFLSLFSIYTDLLSRNSELNSKCSFTKVDSCPNLEARNGHLKLAIKLRLTREILTTYGARKIGRAQEINSAHIFHYNSRCIPFSVKISISKGSQRSDQKSEISGSN